MRWPFPTHRDQPGYRAAVSVHGRPEPLADSQVSRLTPESARQLHAAGFVFDGHNDLAGPLSRGESLDDRDGRGHLDLKRMREGGFDGGVFAVFIDPTQADPLGRTMSGVARLRAVLEDHPAFRLVLSGADLVSQADDGRIAAGGWSRADPVR